MEELLKILKEINSDIDYINTENLISESILKSLEVLQIITELEDKFDIEITPDYMSEENFNSAKAMFKMIQELKNA